MEKSILEMAGGEKHITPHYDIKAENTNCYIGRKSKAILEGTRGVNYER